MSQTIYIFFPPNAEAGGVESLFQGCDMINQIGGDAWLVYDGPQRNGVVPDKYKCYTNIKTTSIHNIERSKDNLVILPEVWTERVAEFSDMKVAIWWLSVNNNHGRFQDFLNDNILHLYQSEYAKNFLQSRGTKTILPLRDYIFEFQSVDCDREDVVCFNPAKGMDKTQFIIQNSPSTVKFASLHGMNKETMIQIMSRCKVYIDFGHHPGRDRIPREAALLGCVVITSKEGSSNNNIDIPIDEFYKIDPLNSSIGNFLQDIIQNYENHIQKFDGYRNIIASDKDTLAKECDNLIHFLGEWNK